MTFKDLQKLVQSSQHLGPEQSQLLQRLKDKPFWIWDQNQHRHEDIRTKGDFADFIISWAFQQKGKRAESNV